MKATQKSQEVEAFKFDGNKETWRVCSYQIDPKCKKTLPPGRGTWHPVIVDSSLKEINNWCCLPCEMHFDDD